MALLDYMPLYVKAGFSFASDWFYQNAGTPWDEVTMRDPLKRHAMQVKQAHFIRQRYPAFFGSDADDLRVHPSLGLGVVTMPILFGSPVRFTPNMDPIAQPALAPGEDPLSLKEPNLDDALQWIFRELDAYIAVGWRKEEIGSPNLQGPLNIAMRVLGDTRMLNLIARPAKETTVRHVLEVVSATYIDVTRALRKATGRPLVGGFTDSGCTYAYLGPSHWLRFILPIVKKIEVIGEEGLHHCGVALTDKIEAYAQYPYTHVEFGFGSDLKRARELFIHPKLGPVPFSCRISPYRMLNQPADQIRQDVEWVIDQAKGGPVSVNVVGVPLGTRDENLWAMYNAVESYNKKKEGELEET